MEQEDNIGETSQMEPGPEASGGEIIKTAEARTGLNFISDLRSALSDRLVIVLFIIWILLTLIRIGLSIAYKPPAEKEPFPREIKMYNRFLYLDFYRSQVGNVGLESLDALLKLVEGNYEIALKQNPENVDLISGYTILLSTNGKKKEAREFFKKKAPGLKNEDLRKTLESIYLFDGEKLELKPDQAATLEESARKSLKGWFRDRTLYLIFQATSDTKKEKVLTAAAFKETHSIMFGLLLLAFILIAGLGLGSLLFVASILSTIFIFQDKSLSATGVSKPGTPAFLSLNLRTMFIVFFTWEIGRFGLGLITTFFFGSTSFIPGWFMFISYVLLYSGIIFLTVESLKKEPGRFSPVGIGLPEGGILKYLKQIFLGMGMYLSAVPVVIFSVLIYQAIFKIPPESSNPAFDIIGGANTFVERLLVYLIIGILGPIFEEILFRGLIYTTIRKYLPAFLSVPIVGFLFALIHYDLGVIFPLFLLGMLLAIIYERTGSLVPAIITHCCWNSMTFALFVTLMR